MRIQCCNDILNISEEGNIDTFQNILQDAIEEKRLDTAKYQLRDWVTKSGYAQAGETYWNYMRKVFVQIIRHNICKANRIQNEQYHIEDDTYKQCFEGLDLTEILRKQNTVSQDAQNGFIWVLSTCVFFVAEYNFSLVTEQN